MSREKDNPGVRIVVVELKESTIYSFKTLECITFLFHVLDLKCCMVEFPSNLVNFTSISVKE